MQQRDYVLLAQAIYSVRKGIQGGLEHKAMDDTIAAISDAFTNDPVSRAWFHRDMFCRLCVMGLNVWPPGTVASSAFPPDVMREGQAAVGDEASSSGRRS
jgi:hypothetical protein